MLNWLKSNHQTVTSAAAMMVSVTALFVAWDQSRVMRAQQHGAVVPAIQVDGFVNNEQARLNLGLRVFNNGVGPAFVESVEVYRDGILQNDLDGLLEPIGARTDDRSWTSMVGRVMAPGQSVEPIRISWPREQISVADLTALTSEFSRWDVQICYCSVFDLCWIATSSNARPRETQQCEPDETDVFNAFGQSVPETAEN